MDLKQITERNYQATVKRGLIKSTTCEFDFLQKFREEVEEFGENYEPSELADIVLVAFAYAEHYNIDIQKALEEKTIYNEKRK